MASTWCEWLVVGDDFIIQFIQSGLAKFLEVICLGLPFGISKWPLHCFRRQSQSDSHCLTKLLLTFKFTQKSKASVWFSRNLLLTLYTDTSDSDTEEQSNCSINRPVRQQLSFHFLIPSCAPLPPPDIFCLTISLSQFSCCIFKQNTDDHC